MQSPVFASLFLTLFLRPVSRPDCVLGVGVGVAELYALQPPPRPACTLQSARGRTRTYLSHALRFSHDPTHTFSRVRSDQPCPGILPAFLVPRATAYGFTPHRPDEQDPESGQSHAGFQTPSGSAQSQRRPSRRPPGTSPVFLMSAAPACMYGCAKYAPSVPTAMRA